MPAEPDRRRGAHDRHDRPHRRVLGLPARPRRRAVPVPRRPRTPDRRRRGPAPAQVADCDRTGTAAGRAAAPGTLGAVTEHHRRSPVVPEVVARRAPTAPAPEVVDGLPVDRRADEPDEQVTRPTKLIRIASMVREDARRGPPRPARRRRPPARCARSTRSRCTSSRASSRPSCSRSSRRSCSRSRPRRRASRSCGIAQAQLVGWLEGLFHGIQATLFTQQAHGPAAARARSASAGALEPGSPGERPPGAYL